jgi:hypothetical protein
MKVLIFAYIGCRFEVIAGLSSELDPLWAGSFNAIGGCYVLSRRATLMVWYVTALLSLAMLVCYVPGYVIQAGPSGLIDAVSALPLGGYRFP